MLSAIAKRRFSILSSHEYLRPNKHSHHLIEQYPQFMKARSLMDVPWNIHLRDSEQFKAKIRQINKDGVENLMIMSDFDYTISKFLYPLDFLDQMKYASLQASGKDRKIGMASMQTMLRAPSMTQECEDRLWELFDKYAPIEKRQDISKAEKSQHMRDWTETNMSDFSKLGMHTREFPEIIQNSEIALRWGVPDFFSTIRAAFPVFFVSGGVKPVIDQIFHDVIYRVENGRFERGEGPDPSDDAVYRQLREHYTLFVLSNDFRYHPDGAVKGYRDTILHSQNKSVFLSLFNEDGALTPYLRKNLIVMGDIVEDCDLANNHDHQTCLKIGLLNNPAADQSALARYLEHYDMVISSDGPYVPVNLILKQIKGTKEAYWERILSQVSDQYDQEVLTKFNCILEEVK